MKGQDVCYGTTCCRLSFSLSVQGGVLRGRKGSQYSLFCERLRWVYGHYSSDSCSQTDRRALSIPVCQSWTRFARFRPPLPHPTKGSGVSLGSTCQCSVHNVRGSCLWFVSFWTSVRCPLCYPRCLTITAPPLCLHFCQSDVFSVTFKKSPPYETILVRFSFKLLAVWKLCSLTAHQPASHRVFLRTFQSSQCRHRQSVQKKLFFFFLNLHVWFLVSPSRSSSLSLRLIWSGNVQ